MGWWPFQVPYSWFVKYRTPAWLRDLLAEVQAIIVTSAFQLAQSYITQIEAKIIEVNSQPISGPDKFKIVFKFTKDLGVATPDSILNVILNALVLKLKNRKAI